MRVNYLPFPGRSQIQALIAVCSSWRRGAEAVLTKLLACGTSAQPPHRVYPCARAEWTALLTSPVPWLTQGLAGWAHCAVLTTFIQLQLSLQPGQEGLTSASNAPCRYSQQSAQGHPEGFSYGLEHASTPVQFNSKGKMLLMYENDCTYLFWKNFWQTGFSVLLARVTLLQSW